LASQLQALARAEAEIGAFPSRLPLRLGWTVDMGEIQEAARTI
jgi:hypothetical protein